MKIKKFDSGIFVRISKKDRDELMAFAEQNNICVAEKLREYLKTLKETNTGGEDCDG